MRSSTEARLGCLHPTEVHQVVAQVLWKNVVALPGEAAHIPLCDGTGGAPVLCWQETLSQPRTQESQLGTVPHINSPQVRSPSSHPPPVFLRLSQTGPQFSKAQKPDTPTVRGAGDPASIGWQKLIWTSLPISTFKDVMSVA